MFDGETHKCCYCSFGQKMVGNQDKKIDNCDCEIDKESKQEVLWMLDFFKKLEIFVDW